MCVCVCVQYMCCNDALSDSYYHYCYAVSEIFLYKKCVLTLLVQQSCVP